MNNPKTLYIFTDNTNRTSGGTPIDPDSWYSQKYKKSTPLRYPTKTSARIRGLENARPISTQKWYNKDTGQTRNKGRWNDSDFAEFKKVIDEEIQDIKDAWDSGQYDNVIVATPAGILRTETNDGISGMTEKRVPKLYHYLEFKLNELNAYVNGREFNKTYQEQQSNDINNTPNTDNDPVNFASQQESLETLNSPKTILTNQEALKLRPFVGDMPRIAVASEHTDPVFFSKKIIKILNGEESVQDRYRPNSYTGKDFNALYLITKHDGLPLKELLEQPIPKIIHFSITGLGGTKWEPGVMKPNDLLDRIADFIKQGLDPEMVTVRIDPIVPGVTSTQMIENIVKRASEMGINKIRYSVMDRYKTTSKYVEAIGYDYSKYYPQGGLHATQEIRDQIDGFMVSMKEKYGVELFTCAEPNSKYADKISKEACLSVAAVNNMLGTSIPETATGNQRQLCSCFGGKTDLLRYDNKCSSSCVYCYAHHNLDKNLNYYNEDGTLKDNPFTRTSKNEGDIQNQSTANPSEFTNHSGGAYGSDTEWDLVGREFGVTDHRHYRDAENPKLSKRLRDRGIQPVILTSEQLETARQKVKQILGVEYPNNIEGNLKVRNYYQFMNADAIYAIGTLTSDKKNVTGGTSTSVSLGIELNKPTYVWDVVTEKWHKFDGNKFTPCETPVLTKNFAGIGTRDTEKYKKGVKGQLGKFEDNPKYLGKEKEQKTVQAIRDVYTKTFGSKPASQPVQLDLFEDKATINVHSRDNNGYRELGNMSVRPFHMKYSNGTVASFQSVEQAFQFAKAIFVKNKDIAAKIIATNKPYDIKELGSHKLPMTAEQIVSWNKVSTDLMYRLMKASFIQNESAKQLLLSTGDAVLTHKDQRGQEQDDGRFSKLLMLIRNEIRQMEEEGNKHKNNC